MARIGELQCPNCGSYSVRIVDYSIQSSKNEFLNGDIRYSCWNCGTDFSVQCNNGTIIGEMLMEHDIDCEVPIDGEITNRRIVHGK